MALDSEQLQELADDVDSADSATEAGQPGWQRTLWVMWTAETIAMMAFSFVLPFLPFYLRELGVKGDAQVALWSGISASATGLTLMVAAPIWGVLADRYGRRPMVLRSMLGGAVVMLLMGVVTNLSQFIALRLAQGLITGTVTAAVAMVSSVTPKARLGYSMGLMQTAVFTGMAVGPWIGGIMADHIGYRGSFYVTAGTLVLAGLLVILGTSERFVPSPRLAGRHHLGIREILAAPGFVTMLTIVMLVNLSGTVAGPLFPLLVEKISVTKQNLASTTGLILAIAGIVAAFSSVIVGRMSDRVGRKNILVACTGTAGIFCVPQAYATSVGQLFGLRALGGLSSGGSGPAVNAIVGSIVPREQYGRAYGLVTSMSCLGSTLGPLAGGAIAARYGVGAAFLITGITLVLVAGVALVRVHEPAAASSDRRDLSATVEII